jgi:hypothetical protein
MEINSDDESERATLLQEDKLLLNEGTREALIQYAQSLPEDWLRVGM